MFNKIFMAALEHVSKHAEVDWAVYEVRELRRHVASIIAGVRGPDAKNDGCEDTYKAKMALTSPIRCWLFDLSPKTLRLRFGFTEGSPFPEDPKDYLLQVKVWRDKRQPHFDHYLTHCRRAMAGIQYLEHWYEDIHEQKK